MQAINEIKRNYDLLSPEEKMDLAIGRDCILRLFIYQIGMIFDENPEKGRWITKYVI